MSDSSPDLVKIMQVLHENVTTLVGLFGDDGPDFSSSADATGICKVPNHGIHLAKFAKIVQFSVLQRVHDFSSSWPFGHQEKE